MKAMLSVLVSPKVTFERIREQGGHFTVPFIAILVIAAVTVLLTMPLLEYQTEQMQQAMGDISADAAAEAAVGMPLVTAISVISSLAGTAASVFIGGLLLMLVNLVVRGEAKYMQLVKVDIFASIPDLIQGLLYGAMAHIVRPADLMTITFSLADLMPNAEGFLRGLLTLVNPFTIWGLALLVIGTAVMARQPAKRVAAWMISGWLILHLLFIWIGTLFGGLGNMSIVGAG